jgi:hypothetical protein
MWLDINDHPTYPQSSLIFVGCVILKSQQVRLYSVMHSKPVPLFGGEMDALFLPRVKTQPVPMYSFGKANHVEPLQGTANQTSNNFVFKLSLAVRLIEIGRTEYGVRFMGYAEQI